MKDREVSDENAPRRFNPRRGVPLRPIIPMIPIRRRILPIPQETEPHPNVPATPLRRKAA